MIPPGSEIILDETFRLCPDDSKTNVCVPFTLKRDYHSLEFFCSYEPKNCDDREKAKGMIQKGLDACVPLRYRDEICEPEHYGSWESFLSVVVNFVTLSVDAPGLYLGCVHRGAPEQRHVISSDFSSPGFFRHPPCVGDWRAVINVHAVVTPELRYRLKILALPGTGGGI